MDSGYSIRRITGGKGRYFFRLFLLGLSIFLSSCSRGIGWGVLLWSSQNPPIPSGTVLPVYLRSDISQTWVVGIPEAYRTAEDGIDKFEIPLTHFEFLGSRRKAEQRVRNFAPYTLTYAENLQDGLPIRDAADNNARRVYRLKTGEIIKILSQVEGNPAVGASGDPLPGEWYRVMTEDGSTGYCFSYRLKFFEHTGGVLAVEQDAEKEEEDPELDWVLARTWSPEAYGIMLDSGHINLEELSRHWSFSPGQDTGIAHIFTSGLEQSFPYTKIRQNGTRSWRFEGTSLQMSLRSASTLAVQYTEAGGMLRSLLFVTLPAELDDIIEQEITRRGHLFAAVYQEGPVFTSTYYGTLLFTQEGNFTWTGKDRLVPQPIPSYAANFGSIDMNLYLSPDLRERYDGAFTLRFASETRGEIPLRFMYTLDGQGLRVEYAPDTSMDGIVVTRRSSSPMILYFFKPRI
ncbi:MAG: SH3 domain-containing protein [Treponema sp.]|jgi:hypothetical protein|nr:SH3 domain-containing protein [Treponema sp.]